MTDQPDLPKRPGRGGTALVAVLVAIIVGFVSIGVVTAATSPRQPSVRPPATGAPSASASPLAVVTPSPSVSPSVTKKAKAQAKAKATPTPVPAAKPQPTKTATISKPTAIVKSLTAKVTRMEAVQGQAEGPGEIAGASVRFTITISNTTGKTVNLSNTVVNAYYGTAATPAVELRMPGGRSFPASVKDGATATGVFIFNIPTAQRAHVEVTVDTSVKNPVVAFKGPAPK